MSLNHIIFVLIPVLGFRNYICGGNAIDDKVLSDIL